MKIYSIRPVCIFLLAAMLLTGVAPQKPVQAQPASGLPASSPAGAMLAPAAPVPHPILSSNNVRRAIAHCTNKAALAQAAYPDLTPAEAQAQVVHSFIPTNSWAYKEPDHVHEFDLAYGQGILASSGWTFPSGATYRSKNGKELALILTFVPDPLNSRYLPVFVEQMRACGVHIILNQQPSSWFNGERTGMQVRDFEVYAAAWGTSIDNPQGVSYFACNKIPLPTNNWTGQNYFGWCNTVASNAIVEASDQSKTHEQRIPYYETVIHEFVMDVPSLPLFARTGYGPNFSVIEHIDLNLHTFMQWTELAPGSAATLGYTDFSGSTGSAAVPAGAVDDSVTLAYTPLVANAYPPPPMHSAVRAFRLGVYMHGLYQEAFQFQSPVTLTVHYSDTDPGPSYVEDSLALYYWTGTSWQDASTTCPEGDRLSTLDTSQNRLQVNICHLTEFSLIAGPHKTYISMVAH